MTVPPLSAKHLYPSPFSSPASLQERNSCASEFGCKPYSQKSPGLSLCSQAAVNLQQLAPEKKACYSSVVRGLNTAQLPLHTDLWWSLSTKSLNPGLGKDNPQLDLTLPYHVLQGSLLCNASCTSIMIQHSHVFSLSGSFPLCHLVIVLPSPFPFICYP